MMNDQLQTLIAALDTDDGRALRHAGDQLLAQGDAARPALIAAVGSPSPRLRKAASFLLGRCKPDAAVIAVLTTALRDDAEPKVRKNAAISLGSLGSEAAVAALAEALLGETIAWIRPSIILALGAIGGDAACTALRTITAQDDAERDALRKALDRCTAEHRQIAWRQDSRLPGPLLLDVPEGLEQIAIAEAREHGINPTLVRPGLLRCPVEVRPWQVFPQLRCITHIAVPLGSGGAIPFGRPDDCVRAVSALLAGSKDLRRIGSWLQGGDGVLRYRLSFVGQPVRRDLLRAILTAARTILEPLDLQDSPSNYDFELEITGDRRASYLQLRPSFMTDTRFTYRQKDVGAAIAPVVAAGLARAVRTRDGARVLDPTCGSGTLLIERVLLDEATRAVGIDISRTATAAARTNVAAADLAARILINGGDSTAPNMWSAYDEVIANLPFGLRTRREEQDLPALYDALLRHTARNLNAGGRALFYSVDRQELEASIAAQSDRLRIVERLHIRSGGLWVNAYILTPRTPS